MLSIIIPSYKDPLLHHTINDLLEKSEGEIEIIPVIDGYTLKEPLPDNPRVRPILLKKNVGMREAINIGVEHSEGEYIMRTDEHCIFGQGFDKILLDTIEDNWIVTPRRYKLDVNTWETIGQPIDNERLIISKHWNKFGARTAAPKDEAIYEKTAMQGSCWIMKKSWWEDVIGKLDSYGYGTHYQDSVEMSFKTWQAGGKLMVNTNTWHAHKHRKFARTHHYPNRLAKECFKYSLDKWGPYYHDVVKKWSL